MRIRGFAPSTPCWAELTSADPVGAASFYAELFGWQLDGDRFMLDGRAVAGLGRSGLGRTGMGRTGMGRTGVGSSATGHAEGWVTYLAATHVEGAAERISTAYGRSLTEPQERAGARSAIVADASGAVFGLWQSAGFAGTQLRGEPGTMVWADLLTDDVPAAMRFYGRVFGWSLTTEFGSGEWLSEAHDSVAGVIPGRPGPRWQPSFQVADTGALIDKCASLGGRVVAGPMEMGLGSYVEIVDPFGAAFAVTAPVERPVELAVAYNDIIGMELTYGG